MAWQFWVPLVVVVVVVVVMVVAGVKFRRASQVFNRIIAQIDEGRADELGRHRSERGRRIALRGQLRGQRGFAGYPPQGQHRSSGRRKP
jgi:hypothetical protein